jgi:hypothetical protein
MIAFYLALAFLTGVFKNKSSALTMLGDCGEGALMTGSNPASSMDLMVFEPNAASCVLLGS